MQRWYDVCDVYDDICRDDMMYVMYMVTYVEVVDVCDVYDDICSDGIMYVMYMVIYN